MEDDGRRCAQAAVCAEDPRINKTKEATELPTMTKAGYRPTEEPKAPAPKRPKKSNKKNRKRPSGLKRINAATIVSLIVFIFAALVALGVVLIWRYTQPYQNAFVPGCRLMGRPLEGMSAQQGAQLLESLTADRIRDWRADLYWGDQVYTLTAEDISLAVDTQATLEPLWEIGRDGGMLARFRAILLRQGDTTDAQPVLTMDEAPIETLVSALKDEVDCEPVDAAARLERNSAEPFSYTDESIGYRLDAAALVSQIRSAALAMEKLETEVEPQILKPSVDRASLEAATVLRARLRADLGEGAGADNAVLSLSAMDGLCIAPGEQWSFNQTVGSRTQEAGYALAAEPAYGPMAEGIGGGVCAASTLIYRLALLADVTVTERHAAAYPTGYAEAGQEAAVSGQGLDLVLENRTGSPLWLRVRLWQEESRQMAELQFIGVPLTEHITLESETAMGAVPAEPVYVRDREGRYAVYTDEQIAVGEALPGITAVTTRVRTDEAGSGITREKLSEDVYEAVPQRIYVGASER